MHLISPRLLFVSDRAPKDLADTDLGRTPRSHDGPDGLLRKEVIQPHLPIRLPCYDLAPINGLTLGALIPCGLREATSGTAIFHGLTGGVYKARERIHRCVLTNDY